MPFGRLLEEQSGAAEWKDLKKIALVGPDEEISLASLRKRGIFFLNRHAR
jgi:hypothetical protein